MAGSCRWRLLPALRAPSSSSGARRGGPCCGRNVAFGGVVYYVFMTYLAWDGGEMGVPRRYGEGVHLPQHSFCRIQRAAAAISVEFRASLAGPALISNAILKSPFRSFPSDSNPQGPRTRRRANPHMDANVSRNNDATTALTPSIFHVDASHDAQPAIWARGRFEIPAARTETEGSCI